MNNRINNAIISKLARYFGTTPESATEEQMYKAVVLSVKDILTQNRSKYSGTIKKTESRRVYYMCMEFLMGRSLKNNLMNLGLAEDYREALAEYGFSLDSLYEREPDPGLGNGGLGRLAACYMDALTSLEYPAIGYSLCYEYGLFKQKIVDGVQIELPDIWMPEGEVWLVPRSDKACTVKLGGHIHEKWNNGKLDIIHENYDEVQAIPYDMMISGADTEAVNVLRLWRAHSVSNLNMNLFSQGQYIKAMEDSTNSEIISKVLYPSDNHTEGKLLRLSQQYFWSSASLQCIISDHLAVYGTLSNFTDKVAIHLNDTHPALCIPELMRILMDVYSYSWDNAWDVVKKTFTYTNHTVLPEALEQWNEDLFRLKLPRIYTIVQEINRRFCADLWTRYPGDWNRISRMAIVADGNIRMANLSVIGSYKVNGVSALHSDILKKSIFRDFYLYEPEKFTNITNGIAHRRWLCYSNEGLTALLDERIGTDYRKNPEHLQKFKEFYNDKDTLEALERIKMANKIRFADYIKKTNGISLDTSSIFDVQVKRLHEYKRQLLNALRIISLYTKLLENPDIDMTPQTFIFGAKAAPGYEMTKEIIRLIYNIGQDIEMNPKIREKLRVVFIEDYKVSIAEILMPAAEISEQISVAGKEASGTGNMKFMINGAVTIGTLDGANVEMREAVGDENIFIFGLDKNEAEDLWRRGYRSSAFYNTSENLKQAVDYLNIGFNGNSFGNIVRYLLHSSGIADPYMCLADFDSYCAVHDLMTKAYHDRTRWNNISLMNIASAGYFAADRSITQYADEVWNIGKVKMSDKCKVLISDD